MKRPNKRTTKNQSKRKGFRNGVKELGVRALFAIPSILLVLKSYEKLVGQALRFLSSFFNQALAMFMNFLSMLDSTAILKIGSV
jgi:hypothetical protein